MGEVQALNQDGEIVSFIWIAREKDGGLFAFENKPELIQLDKNVKPVWFASGVIARLPPSFFPVITFEVSPQKVTFESSEGPEASRYPTVTDIRDAMRVLLEGGSGHSGKKFVLEGEHKANYVRDMNSRKERRSSKAYPHPPLWPFIPRENELIEIVTPNHEWAVGSVYTVEGCWIDLNMSNGDRLKIAFDEVNMTRKGYNFRRHEGDHWVDSDRKRALELLEKIAGTTLIVNSQFKEHVTAWNELHQILGGE